jgi:hypothetical protein
MTHIKRQLRKCLSIIQPISRKRAIISHLNSLNTKRIEFQCLRQDNCILLYYFSLNEIDEQILEVQQRSRSNYYSYEKYLA